MNWIGHQTRITGEVVRSGAGFAVTARAGTSAGSTFRGNDLDALIDDFAEKLFGETQPYRYGIYLSSHGREDEAKTVLLALAQSDAPASERAWAYSGLLFVENNTRYSEQYGFQAIALNPDLLLAHNNLSAVAWRLGHSEFNYRETATGLKLLNEDAGVELDQRALGNMHSVLAEEADAALGDFEGAAAEMRADLSTEHSNLRGRSQAYLMRDLALAHDVESARHVAIDGLPSGSRATANRQILLSALARGLTDMEANDFQTAKDEFTKGVTELGPGYVSVQLQAPLTLALAKLGNLPAARALAAKLPADCYPCLVSRAEIEGATGNWRTAEFMFAEAARQAPSLPFAYNTWGAMLLQRGEYDAAIAMFAMAHAKGPRFGEPLEQWGEALMEKNRSDLAIAKFDEANKFAPDWGRLDLEWGKALAYLGRTTDAQQQFAAASRLDLSAADRAALSKWTGHHG